jgi:hypothetical protein
MEEGAEGGCVTVSSDGQVYRDSSRLSYMISEALIVIRLHTSDGHNAISLWRIY